MNRVMMSANTLKELEKMFLTLPISYGVSVNVAYYGNDLSKIQTNWNSEYYQDSEENGHSADYVFPVSWSYEIAPNANSSTRNVVSKHCIIPKSISKRIAYTLPSYYADEYLSHFNQ